MKPLLYALTLFLLTHSASANDVCPLANATYEPVGYDGITKKNDLRFRMNFLYPPANERGAADTSLYMRIDAFNRKNNTKLSTLLFTDMCTNGTNICRFAAYDQAGKSKKNEKRLKTHLVFDAIALDKDYARVSLNSAPAPLLYILPNTRSLFFKEINNPDSHSNFQYTTMFHTPEKIIPDFSGYDVWKLTSCAH